MFESVSYTLYGAGVDRILAMDLHSDQCVGYFDIPVDHVYGNSVLLDYLTSKRISTDELVVVAPDAGGVARARAFAKQFNDAPLAIVDKRRSAHNVSEVMNVIGEVKGKVAVVVDDMIDTAGRVIWLNFYYHCMCYYFDVNNSFYWGISRMCLLTLQSNMDFSAVLHAT